MRPFGSVARTTAAMPARRRLAPVVLAAALLGVVAGVLSPSPAAASTTSPLTWGTACASDLDVAACERLTWIANKLDDPAPAAEPVSGTIALDGDASDRLDLVWWGEWFACGLLLVLLIASSWRRLFNWAASGGDV